MKFKTLNLLSFLMNSIFVVYWALDGAPLLSFYAINAFFAGVTFQLWIYSPVNEREVF